MTNNQLPQATWTPLETPVVPRGELVDRATSQRIDGDLADVMRLFYDPDASNADVVLTQYGLEGGTDHTTNMSCTLTLFIGEREVWSTDVGVMNGRNLVPDTSAIPKFIDEVRFVVNTLAESGMFEAFDPDLGARVGAR